MKNEIQIKLEKLARSKVIPFCYQDYCECPKGICPKCGTDDLMFLYPSVGCEYGLDWCVEHLLSEKLTPVDTERTFEDSVRELYNPTTVVGFLTVDTVDTMKECDPIAWEIACSENTDLLESDEIIMSFDNGNTYYWTHDLEALE